MKILVVSGFLGAGKTTFIKELIQQSQKRLVILENEYGETDLDSQELRSTSQQPDVLEFMEGCVCCSQKDSFANSLIAISAALNPEYLVVEPTGVGKLSNILVNINKIVWEQIQLLPPIVVLAPRSYFANMQEYGDIYRDQIKNASYIIFSKIENENTAAISAVKNEIKSINPNAEIIDTPYRQKNASWFSSLLEDSGQGAIIPEAVQESAVIDQYTLKNVHMAHPSQLLRLLEQLVHGGLGSIARAKGTIACTGEWYRFDVADGLYIMTGAPEANTAAQCVFIGNQIDRSSIDKYFISDAPVQKRTLERLKISKSSRKRKL